MRVLVTGGTGFVGSHTVAAVIKSGHDVRLLARSRDRVESALAPHDCETPEVVVGDITDPQAVVAALTGCEAVIHAANIFSFDPRQCETMSNVNERGTDLLLTEASRLNLDPIVHVSSFAALLPSDEPLTADSEVGTPAPPYCKSKAAAEHVARRFQADGIPVVIIYPGSVWGPHDPYLGESDRVAQSALKGKLRLLNNGLLPISDVRDVATAHAAVLRPGLGPRRYIVVGHNPNLRALISRLGEVAGRNLWSIPVPSTMAFMAGRAADWASLRFGIRPSLNFAGPWIAANTTEADSSLARDELGIDFAPLDKTLFDTTKWLFEAGHISHRQAGLVAA